MVKRALRRVSSPAILVGHSYGGSVITAAGTDDRVVGLVYIAAVAPDGVIEAIEHEPHKHWVVGVQWHPERMTGDALAAALFRALVQATRAAALHH